MKDPNGNVIEEVEKIGEACEQYYKEMYAPVDLPELDFSTFDEIAPRFTLTEDLQNEMVGEVTREEIYGVLTNIQDDKAPGNDGFSSCFFKSAWHVVGDDFVKAVQNFFKSGKMLKEVNATCITLVPKTESPASLGDYRPIACCNVVYKCITKVITNRMKVFMDRAVSQSQSAFIAGRCIQDNILLSHEILHGYHKNRGPKRCAVKVDLRKAYDTVRWEAVEFALERIGVPAKFRRWVSECMQTARY